MTDQDGMCGDKLRDCFSCQVSEHGDQEKRNDSDDGEKIIVFFLMYQFKELERS